MYEPGDLRGQCGELRLLVAGRAAASAEACGPSQRLPLSDMLRLLALGSAREEEAGQRGRARERQRGRETGGECVCARASVRVRVRVRELMRSLY